MKKLILMLFAAGLLSSGFISCRERHETVGDKIDDAVDDVEDAVD